MKVSMLWSRYFLKQRWVLWSLFLTNSLGTIYGYYWYKYQLVDTWEHSPKWQIVFVPDSPTASLFFSLALLFLLFPMKKQKRWLSAIRVVIEALAVVTSIKYGIWACAMILAGAYQGESLIWQDWMLISSHLAMAIEAVLFVRLFRFAGISLCLAAAWTWLNDYVDYKYDVYPYLPQALWDDVSAVSTFTIILTGVSVVTAGIACYYRLRQERMMSGSSNKLNVKL
ncbi:DUF1405 domain-containing protein [Paenibacillus sp. ACRRX]|uniref:DUF1405 domain-containing protein n=1 Tax=Paenibacillus sp. ACRRX TaxID=2918206 RepID=UPI001EF5022D|nr:DUF1405 domain-containing protein [Paenibacillus sp. ACRRX]MCG7406476.1 DUF1405 domain-containing protein [Paenibacillus sp. ACRRX]